MMITRRFFLMLTLTAAMLPLPFTRAADQPAAKPNPKNDARKAELQEKFKKRYPEIRAAKQAGTIGETSDGYLDFVTAGDKKLQKLVEEENADRKELYGLIAAETSITTEAVAQRAAKRNFEHARAGEYLKDDGKWTKKSK
jgi:uncharacterized protein YdbL (DUF1318 family)